MTPAPATSAPDAAPWPTAPASPPPAAAAGAVSFADIAERLNPAVVNIDATSRGDGRDAGALGMLLPGQPGSVRAAAASASATGPRRGAGTGFIIDAGGLHPHQPPRHRRRRPHHGAADRRPERCAPSAIGSDPDTDIALIKVESPRPLPFAPLGDSDALRVGEWVLAIGNPLAYEHTVTVGVVSFIGRKLFDTSLDRYIQTDAAINFGNSGGPLINARGEVIGINAAISSRASNIGFAVPINQASAILPQLRDKRTRVARLHRRDAARRRSGSAAVARPDVVRRARWCRTSRRARPARAPASAPTTSSSRSTASRSTATTS